MTVITGSYGSYSVTELAETRAFYRDVLGLEISERGAPMETDPDGVYRGIGPHFAWFTDPSDNVLALCETTRDRRIRTTHSQSPPPTHDDWTHHDQHDR